MSSLQSCLLDFLNKAAVSLPLIFKRKQDHHKQTEDARALTVCFPAIYLEGAGGTQKEAGEIGAVVQ